MIVDLKRLLSPGRHLLYSPWLQSSGTRRLPTGLSAENSIGSCVLLGS